MPNLLIYSPVFDGHRQGLKLQSRESAKMN